MLFRSAGLDVTIAEISLLRVKATTVKEEAAKAMTLDEMREAMAKMEEDNKKAGLRLERTGAILKTITKVIDVDVVLSKEFPNVTEQFGDTISQIDAAIADNNSYLQNNLGWQRQLVHIRNHLNVALAENAYWQSQIILWMVDSNTGDIIPNPEAEVELAKLVAYENQMTDSLCDINTQLGGTIDPVTEKLLYFAHNPKVSAFQSRDQSYRLTAY